MEEENRMPADEEAELTELSDGAADEYAFMTETVRKRPGRGRKICLGILTVLLGGVIFGVTSGLIFRSMNPSAAEYISFSQDADETGEEGTGSSDATENGDDDPESVDEAGQTDAADDGQGTGDGSELPQEEEEPDLPEPTPVPEPTPEELRAARISDYKELYGAMCGIAEESERSLVTVHGITSTEDWFETVSENRKSMSGLIIADAHDSLLILTDQGVAADTERLLVVFPDGSAADAQLLKADQRTGLAVLTVPAESVSETVRAGLTVADLGNSYSVRRGQPVIAIGRPVGVDNGLGFGEVTSLSDAVQFTDSRFTLVTTDIYGSLDGSGFLIDLDGRFVGVIKEIYSPEGSHTVAAIAISPIKSTIEKLSNNEAICYLGIQGDNVTAEISAETGIPTGVYVTGVEADSPAAGAGILPGDVITAIGSDTISGMETYQRVLMAKTTGDPVILTAQRLGAEGYVPLEFEMTVGGI